MKKRYTKLSLILLWTGRILLNICVWYLILSMLHTNNLRHSPYIHSRSYWWHIGFMQLLLFILIYGNSFILVPLFIPRKKYAQYLAALFIWGIIFAWAIGYYQDWLYENYPGVPNTCYSSFDLAMRYFHSDNWSYYAQMYLSTVVIIQFIFTPGWLVHYFYKARRKVETLSALQTETELRLLKAQIHPHFLFNVLNSIYALSLKKSDKTPEMVLRLSDCLRYLLYESGQEKVPLAKEIKLLQDYIAIEKMRLAHPEKINLQVNGSINDYVVSPALLLPFVENAVKHGFNRIANDCWVQIGVYIRPVDDTLDFICRNTFHDKLPDKKKTGGIGLQNVRKRLELCYPGQHDLMIQTKNNIFEVNLNLKLSAQ